MPLAPTAVVPVRSLTVSVMTMFCLPPRDPTGAHPIQRVGDRALTGQLPPDNSQPVASATVTLGPLSATTNRFGHASLRGAIADGDHVLRVEPTAAELSPGPASLAHDPSHAQRQYRAIDIELRLSGGRFTQAQITDANVVHASVQRVERTRIVVDLKPDWLPIAQHPTRGTAAPEMVIVHHTGGDTIGGALRQWIAGPTGADFTLDRDGHVVKLTQTGEFAHHAGRSWWFGFGRPRVRPAGSNISDVTVGIEVVAGPNYDDRQYPALVDLINAICTHHTIPLQRVIGHNDIGCNDRGVWGRKATDPGVGFEWHRLELAGLGIIPQGAVPPTQAVIYGGIYRGLAATAAPLQLGRGDGDFPGYAAPTGPAFAGPVTELQTDIRTIGYCLPAITGTFDGATEAAVRGFQEHFFAAEFDGPGSVFSGTRGRVDLATANRIKMVRAVL